MRNYFPTYSAEISIKGDFILYRIEDRNFEFYIPDILLIGEFSAPPGMYGADYFFCILMKDAESPLDIPAYADGMFETLNQLRERIPDLGRPKLQLEDGFASAILFPASLSEQPLYDFRTQSRPWVNLPVLRNIAMTEKVSRELSEDVRELVAAKRS